MIKNYLFAVLMLMTIGASTGAVSQTKQPMTKKEMAFKAARVLAYTGEFIMCAGCYYFLNKQNADEISTTGHDTYSFAGSATLNDFFKDKSVACYEKALFAPIIGTFHVPFFVTFYHSLRGLYTEVAPLMKKNK